MARQIKENREVKKSTSPGKVTSMGGGNFATKYPEVLQSVTAVVSPYSQNFKEKEIFAMVNVNHNVTSAPAINQFCTYLIDGSSDSISQPTTWATSTIDTTAVATLQLGEGPTEEPSEPTKETNPPEEVVAVKPTPKPIPRPKRPVGTPSTDNVSNTRGRGRGRSTGRSGGRSYSGSGSGRGGGGSAGGRNQYLGGAPSGRGRYEYETRNMGSESYVYRNQMWNML